MSFNQPVEEELEIRRKRLRYQAWHCGMRELDLILGAFVDRHAAALSAADMDALEALLHVPAATLYRWLAGQEAISPDHDTPVIHRVISSTARLQGQ
ncbi:MAG: succinate dehydrogenase assembly factor 2 [Alphaproteobacteria bacterium]